MYQDVVCPVCVSGCYRVRPRVHVQISGRVRGASSLCSVYSHVQSVAFCVIVSGVLFVSRVLCISGMGIIRRGFAYSYYKLCIILISVLLYNSCSQIWVDEYETKL
ncbi:hypothetical protein M6B38_393725 [Iris pallida]|uniref:Uncharacterized protein n=1 Tax=Iris pallida TaxID=29817 RepID=A0AAX6FYF3_IRIPA|nr:hypothetical protein M6B38_393725 [Iris pallida]